MIASICKTCAVFCACFSKQGAKSGTAVPAPTLKIEFTASYAGQHTQWYTAWFPRLAARRAKLNQARASETLSYICSIFSQPRWVHFASCVLFRVAFHPECLCCCLLSICFHAAEFARSLSPEPVSFAPHWFHNFGENEQIINKHLRISFCLA